MPHARFLSLDGIDGAGKSTQLRVLADWLRQRGITVETCRDPGSTPAGDAIRAILLDRHDVDLAPRAEMLLYMAARAQLVAEVIGPALARGAWVLADRYLLANVVYQGHAGGLGPELVRQVGEVATCGVMPDLSLVLDLELATAAIRLDRPLDKLENRGEDYRRRLRDGYRAEAARQPDRVRLVDAGGSVDTVAATIQAAIVERFPELA
jgi:dTMP kinase